LLSNGERLLETEKVKTVPCADCDKPLDITSLKDGSKMILLDGSEINICHRCAAIKNGFRPEDFDAVWGKIE
jgi:hypothetical protein